MISKNTEKLLRKLQSKKYRWNYKMFIAEGPKVVAELLEENMNPEFLISDQPDWVSKGAIKVGSSSLKSLSQLDTANEVIGVFPFPEIKPDSSGTICLVLDRLNDPGNLGTILRTCDWFGISKVYCTTGTTDVYNAKCIQSTMGSIARVEVHYLSDEEIHSQLKGYRLLVADMNGVSAYDQKNDSLLALIMGSESHGPSDFWKSHAEAVTIPRIAESKIESLNVAQATGIILSHLVGK